MLGLDRDNRRFTAARLSLPPALKLRRDPLPDVASVGKGLGSIIQAGMLEVASGDDAPLCLLTDGRNFGQRNRIFHPQIPEILKTMESEEIGVVKSMGPSDAVVIRGAGHCNDIVT